MFNFSNLKNMTTFAEREGEASWEDNGNGSKAKRDTRAGVGDRKVEG